MVLVVGAARVLIAQAPVDPLARAHGPLAPDFRTGVELVTLTVTVEQPNGELRSGLVEQHFRVLEEGVPQDIAFFDEGTVPIDLVLILDTSASMRGRMAITKRAAVNFIATLRPGDRAAIMTVGRRTSVLQPFSSDISALTATIGTASAAPGGTTALYDAVYIALKEFGSVAREEFEVRRRALVMLSDGTDTASLLPFDAVLDLARRSDVAIYPISLVTQGPDIGDRRRFEGDDFELRMLARETGARAFFPTALEDLAGVYGSIARELSHQYSLGYTPQEHGEAGEFRRVVVTVDAPNLIVRTRRGYLTGD